MGVVDFCARVWRVVDAFRACVHIHVIAICYFLMLHVCFSVFSSLGVETRGLRQQSASTLIESLRFSRPAGHNTLFALPTPHGLCASLGFRRHMPNAGLYSQTEYLTVTFCVPQYRIPQAK